MAFMSKAKMAAGASAFTVIPVSAYSFPTCARAIANNRRP